jgi:hypothetical protein
MVVQRSSSRLCDWKSFDSNRLHNQHNQHNQIEVLLQRTTTDVGRTVAPRNVVQVVQVVQVESNQRLRRNAMVEQVVQKSQRSSGRRTGARRARSQPDSSAARGRVPRGTQTLSAVALPGGACD